MSRASLTQAGPLRVGLQRPPTGQVARRSVVVAPSRPAVSRMAASCSGTALPPSGSSRSWLSGSSGKASLTLGQFAGVASLGQVVSIKRVTALSARHMSPRDAADRMDEVLGGQDVRGTAFGLRGGPFPLPASCVCLLAPRARGRSTGRDGSARPQPDQPHDGHIRACWAGARPVGCGQDR